MLITMAEDSRRREVYRRSNPLPKWFWPIFWLTWALLGIAVEIYALLNKQTGDTLSEQVWAYITGRRWPIYVPKSAAWAGRIILAVFFIWLAPHFIFAVWT